jgi:hypothetical protein
VKALREVFYNYGPILLGIGALLIFCIWLGA